MKQVACKLCGRPFICDNGRWYTTCDCAQDRADELKDAHRPAWITFAAKECAAIAGHGERLFAEIIERHATDHIKVTEFFVGMADAARKDAMDPSPPICPQCLGSGDDLCSPKTDPRTCAVCKGAGVITLSNPEKSHD